VKKEYDVAIIGGGPGGLSIGTLLAKEGISSVILEKDPTPGGRIRSVDFAGCKVDCATHFLVSLEGSVEKTSVYQHFKKLGLPLEYKIIPWAMSLVTKEKPGQIDFFEMDPALGASNFFEFFAFATGVEMSNESKEELMHVATICADMSEEECHKVVNVSFADWIDKNVKDPIAQAVMLGMEPVVGAPATNINFGYVAKAFGTFISAGAPLIWYPDKGTLETAFVDPQVKYYKDHGGEIVTNRIVSSISIENGKATGVIAVDFRNRYMIEEYSSKAVICAMPIFEAVAKNVLSSESITEEWAESIRRCAALSGPDLSGFFLLNKEVLPEDGCGWMHIFDTDYGLPTYVGDCTLGSYINSSVPKGKQLVTSMIPGSLTTSQFGLNPTMDKVKAAHNAWKESIEKPFPGFNDAIEYEGMNLQLNFTRYAYAVVPTELEIQSPNIEGLYFGGDSIWALGKPMQDKCYEIAFPLCDRIREYLNT